MKAFRSLSSLAASLSVLALTAGPAVPPTAIAAQLNTADIDLAIARAAKTVVAATQTQTPAPVAKGTLSGGNGDEDDVICVVKFWEPEELKTKHDYGTGKGYYNGDHDTVVFLQAKLICDDTVGDAELLIEQNDQLVVAQSISNFQTNVSMFSATVKLNEEQEDTFCVAIARADDDGNFEVVGQECWPDLGDHDYSYKGGRGG